MKQQDAGFLRLPVWSYILHFICCVGVWISSFRYHFQFGNFNILKVNNRIKQVVRWEVSISKHIIRGQILLDELVFDVCLLNSLLLVLTRAVSEAGRALQQQGRAGPCWDPFPHPAPQTHTGCSCFPILVVPLWEVCCINYAPNWSDHLWRWSASWQMSH